MMRHRRSGKERAGVSPDRGWHHGREWSRRVVVVIALVAALSAAWAGEAPPALTPDQEAAARRIDGMLMAPCCFANTLAEHHSPIAAEMKQQVRAMIASGSTEDEVLAAFLDRYGERILAAPLVQGFNWMAYLLPVAALAAGCALIGLMLRGRRSTLTTTPLAPMPERLRERMLVELAEYDPAVPAGSSAIEH